MKEQVAHAVRQFVRAPPDLVGRDRRDGALQLRQVFGAEEVPGSLEEKRGGRIHSGHDGLGFGVVILLLRASAMKRDQTASGSHTVRINANASSGVQPSLMTRYRPRKAVTRLFAAQ
jgi:hypothetical protein